MSPSSPAPKFSIILATRDRPGLFEVALNSVLDQQFDNFEVVVVNDGSTEENSAAYRAILENAIRRTAVPMSSHWLVRRPKGHGQSYSLNYGVSHSRGRYVGFLDDDDEWTDDQHLARAARAIDAQAAVGPPADLYMANQKAYLHDEQAPGPIWLEALEPGLRKNGASPGKDGSYTVSVADLLGCGGFAHLNCLIVRRALYDQIGGMDEGIRWECDRDLFLRLIDKSLVRVHHPAHVSRHNIPDPAKTTNMTTALSMIDKRLLQVRVLDKAALFATNPLLRKHAIEHKGYALKKIAEELADIGDWRTASVYATEAFGVAPSLKWLGFASYCMVRRLFGRTPVATDTGAAQS